jgi:hypothetical protein
MPAAALLAAAAAAGVVPAAVLTLLLLWHPSPGDPAALLHSALGPAAAATPVGLGSASKGQWEYVSKRGCVCGVCVRRRQ